MMSDSEMIDASINVSVELEVEVEDVVEIMGVFSSEASVASNPALIHSK
jgi:hypothetical protein